MFNNISSKKGLCILAEHKSDDLSVFIVGEKFKDNKPANGGLRLLCYPSDADCINDGLRLANLMKYKHDIYSTGFSGGKVVARAKNPLSIKQKLITITAELLESLDGQMITGCDLNTTINDMEQLQQLTPHVLAAVGSDIDASTATAYGVIGALDAYQKKCLNSQKRKVKTALVHGCGAVGSVVTKLLLKMSWRVLTVDIDPVKSHIDGAIAIDPTSKWWNENFDVLIPCSISGLLTKNIVHSLKMHAVVPAANAPFSDTSSINILREKNIDVIPDPIVNAGAVIADSIELFDPYSWNNADPDDIYKFVKACVFENTSIFLNLIEKGLAVEDIIRKIIEMKSSHPIGLSFSQRK
tara:strand:- start:4455 stop:5516 length:1062 start_codon:yes stop_codon:yes gene_type:complete